MIQKIKNYFHSDFLQHEGITILNHKNNLENFGCFNPAPTEMVYYQTYNDINKFHFSGIKNLLGYQDKTLTIEQLFNLIHPDDLPDVFKAIKNILNIFPDKSFNYQNSYSIFTYRLKHKKKNYITILRDTRALSIKDGRIGGHINKVSDISYLNIPKKAKAWYGINNKAYPLLENKFQKLFTRREKEILYLLAHGRTSDEIASFLYIEKSTVDKHRQNLLSKANVENTMQLVTFSIENELINLPFKQNMSIVG